MSQYNKRPGAAPRQYASGQPHRGPAPRPAAPRQAAPRRMPEDAAPRRAAQQPVYRPAASGGVNGDLIKLAVGGVLAVVLAFVLQNIWPNGFPLVQNAQQGSVAAQSMVSEIYSGGPLRINEIMTGNRSTLTLSDDTSPDWIEVMNTGSASLNLEGYSLSKTANDTTRTFTFPAMKLAAGECVLVYADSRLRDNPEEALHAPFRLSSSGDTLMLFNPGGTAIDTVNISALDSDCSYARMETYSWQTCETPTPGLSNTQESYIALQKPADNSPVVISEVMSTNTRTLKDENGHYYDYIELYNRSGEAVDLDGWYLSDDTQSLRKWRFPQVILGSGEYIVVYASKLDRKANPAYLHTNFGLSSEGESLLLVNPEGRIMNRLDFDLLKSNVALSLKADGTWATDAAPSPGKANP